MRIVNLNKFIRSIAMFIGIIFLILLLINKPTLSHTETEYKTIYISNGDTLWNIAQNLQSSDYYYNKDVRDIVNNIMEINDLTSSTLYINQELRIPI